jgi:hypothetical protein
MSGLGASIRNSFRNYEGDRMESLPVVADRYRNNSCNRFLGLAVLSLIGCCCSLAAFAGSQIKQPIDEAVRTRRAVHIEDPIAQGLDLGSVDADFPVAHLWLRLKRSPEREAELARFIEDDLYAEGSPHYHQWLTAEQLGALYGPDPDDIGEVRRWIEGHGFTINTVYPSGLLIDFSGTARQLQETFGASLHRRVIDGKTYLVNTEALSIPSALDGVVAGLAPLTTYHPPRARIRPALSYPAAVDSHSVAPADFNTIYDVWPLWNAGIRGAGQTIYAGLGFCDRIGKRRCRKSGRSVRSRRQRIRDRTGHDRQLVRLCPSRSRIQRRDLAGKPDFPDVVRIRSRRRASVDHRTGTLFRQRRDAASPSDDGIRRPLSSGFRSGSGGKQTVGHAQDRILRLQQRQSQLAADNRRL